MRTLNSRTARLAVLILVLAVFASWENIRETVSEAATSSRDASLANAQWMRTTGPEGGTVYALLNTGTSLFAGTDGGGIFVSANGGQNWTARNTGLTDPYVFSITSTGTHLFAGTGATKILPGAIFGGNVFRSSDNGQSWVVTNAGLPDEPVHALLAAGANILAGTERGLFLSTDDGETWDSVDQVQAAVSALAASGASVFASTNAGIFRSTDNGRNWVAVNGGLPANKDTRSLATSGTSLLAGTTQGLFLSTDNGASWKSVSSDLEMYVISTIAVSGNSLFVGTNDNGVFRSTDNGQRWTPASIGLGSAIIYSLAVNGANILAGIDRGGVFRSSDGGQQWSVANTGLTCRTITSLVVSEPNIFAGTNRGEIFRSDNKGQSWVSAGNGLLQSDFIYSTSLTASGRNIFAKLAISGSMGSFSTIVYRSSDNGNSWNPAIIGSNGNITHTVVNGSHVAAGAARGVHFSNDGGETWKTVTTDANHPTSLVVVGASYFVAVGGKGVYRSTNNGDNWVLADTQLASLVATQLAFNGTAIFAATANRIFRSTNNGESWVLLNTALAVNRLFVVGTSIFAITGSTGIFRSANNGDSWVAANTGLKSSDLISFALLGPNLFVGTDSAGIFASTNNGLSWAEVNAGLTNNGGFTNLNALSLAASGTSLFAGTDGSGVVILSGFPPAVASVSAASFSGSSLASESIVAAFGSSLAITTQVAITVPLPTTLANTTVKVTDSAGVQRSALLFFISPTQVNYQMPPGTTTGTATVTTTSGDGFVSIGTVQITPVAPGIFSANASGQGVAAAVALRISADGSQTYEPVGRFDPVQNKVVAVPIDLGPDTDQVFLILYGTGIRHRSSLMAVSALIGGVAAEVIYAGSQGDFVGLDQVNLRIPRSLKGRGEVDVALNVDGFLANIVRMAIR